MGRSLAWWLRHDPKGRRDWRFRLCMLAVWVALWRVGWLSSDWWVLPLIVLLHVGDLLLSYYWWRRDLSKAENVPSE